MKKWNRWRAAVRPNVKREVEEEIAFHLEMRVRALMEAGRSEDEARAEAARIFGDVAAIDAECRDVGESRNRKFGRMRLMEDVRADVRFAMRSLRKTPGFTVVAMLTIAVGVASTTSIFSAVNGILMRSLPFPGANELVVPQSQDTKNGSKWSISYADYEDWKQQHVFARVALYSTRGVNAIINQQASWLQAVRSTPDFFETLGVQPEIGRLFSGDDYALQDVQPVVISHEYWQKNFGGAQEAIGRTMTIAGVPSQIIGVIPSNASFPAGTDLWLPLRVRPKDYETLHRSDNFVYSGIARLLPGSSSESTIAQLRRIEADIAAKNPSTRKDVSATITPLDEWVVGKTFTRTLWLFMGAVVVVLLIACVNIASLILSRATTRAREIALRKALGAGRPRIIRQLITESLVLAVGGGVIGTALSFAIVRLIVANAPTETPRLHDVGVNTPVLVFALVVTGIAALLFGLYPAVQSSRSSESATLTEGSVRTTGTLRTARGRSALVVCELALSLVLMAAAGLMLRSFANLEREDTGLVVEHATSFTTSLQGTSYDDPAVVATTLDRMIEQLRSIPGVTNAAATSALPLGGGGMYLGRGVLKEGQPEPPASKDLNAEWNIVTPSFFDAVGTRVVKGRSFSAADAAGSRPVAIINRELANRLFPGQDPVGKRVLAWRDEKTPREIVGVVEDVRYYAAGDLLRPILYVPHAQNAYGNMAVIVRTRGAVSNLEGSLRAAVRHIDPNIAVANVQTMSTVRAASIAPQRFTMVLLSFFAAVAMGLALIGVYGVLAYTVSQRTREMAVRVALGAQPSQVRRLVLRQAGLVIALGVSAGTVLAFVLTQFMTSILYDVRPGDPATFVAAASVVTLIAFCASVVPARRATRVEPMFAMRAD